MVGSSPGSPQIPSLKRARSDTGASASMSPKRANSEVVEDIMAGTHRDDDIGEYMRLQDADNEADIGLTSLAGLDEPTTDGALTGQEQYQTIKNLEKVPLELGSLWYGKLATCLPREVIAYFPTETRVEVYPPVFRVYSLLAPDVTTPVPSSRVNISSLLHLSVLAARAAIALQISTDRPYRVWNVPSQTPTADGIRSSDIERGTLVPIPLNFKTPISEFIKISDILIVETQTPAGQWAFNADSVTLATEADAEADTDELPLFPSNQGWLGKMQTQHTAKNYTANPDTLQAPARGVKSAFSGLSFRGKSPAPAVQRGTMGVQNLGNTCFMNSALQCLAHIPELDQYFLSGLYRHEVNPDNPLGMQGQIANSFGALLHHLYPATDPQLHQPLNPSTEGIWLEDSAAETRPRLMPLASSNKLWQHNTQEFLGFLLGGLHEDLNRVLKEPYVEKPEWPETGGGCDVEARLAKDTWEGYERRNDSIIVDLFQGMHKNTLVCPECAKVSIMFNPFMYLTLPLPITKTWRHVIHYVPWESISPPLTVQIEVPRNSSYGYLRKLFGRWFNVDPENLLSVEIWSRKFYKFYDDYMNLTDLAEKDTLVLYELPIPFKSAAKPPPQPRYGKFSKAFSPPGLSTPQPAQDSAPFILPVFHASVNQRGVHSAFGIPFLVVLSPVQACSREAIYRAVVERCESWTRLESDLWRYRGGESRGDPTR
ncbi:CSN-associated deubiquitinating enzyme Ubp12 [Ceratobasidium sp. 395]|nr:CSN-associated deubiquitinating enzyme Ubp12 [Ceratobasidium sp. 395]